MGLLQKKMPGSNFLKARKEMGLIFIPRISL
jgi:hypothetical protein